MDFGAWQIWNGGAAPVAGLVQVQLASQTRLEAMKERPRRADALDWTVVGTPRSITAYRALSGPYTVALFGHENTSGQWIFTEGRDDADTHRIRFRMVAGAPDVASIDMVAG